MDPTNCTTHFKVDYVGAGGCTSSGVITEMSTADCKERSTADDPFLYGPTCGSHKEVTTVLRLCGLTLACWTLGATSIAIGLGLLHL